jgi:predicted aspartyl protease
MSRIIKQIEIEGKPAMALFDTGATLSYIRRELIQGVPKRALRQPYRVGLGGGAVEVREVCVAIGEIDGLELDMEAVPVDDLGRTDGHVPDAVIGALVMEKWEIKLDPKTGALDLTGLRRREFTEF